MHCSDEASLEMTDHYFCVCVYVASIKTEKSPGDEEDDSEAEDEEGEEHALIKKEKKQDKKMKKPENIVDVLHELVGLPVSRDDAHWFDCVSR